MVIFRFVIFLNSVCKIWPSVNHVYFLCGNKCPRLRTITSYWEMHESLSKARVILHAEGNFPYLPPLDLIFGLWGTIWVTDDLTCFWVHLDGILHEGSYQKSNFSSKNIIIQLYTCLQMQPEEKNVGNNHQCFPSAKALCMMGKSSTTELHLQPFSAFRLIRIFK